MYQFIWAGTAATVGKLVSTSTIPSKQGNSDDFAAGSVGAFWRSICHEIPGRGNVTDQFWRLSSLHHSKLYVSSLRRPIIFKKFSDEYFILILRIIWYNIKLLMQKIEVRKGLLIFSLPKMCRKPRQFWKFTGCLFLELWNVLQINFIKLILTIVSP